MWARLSVVVVSVVSRVGHTWLEIPDALLTSFVTYYLILKTGVIIKLTYMPLCERVKITCNQVCKAFNSYSRCSRCPGNLSNNNKTNMTVASQRCPGQ